MGRVFITGDKHGNYSSPDDYKKIHDFCAQFETTTEDVMIVLGDHGIHYDGSYHDETCRRHLGKLPITFVMIRGNHDMRPCSDWKWGYENRGSTMRGFFFHDPECENILYTNEYGWYTFAGKHVFVIGGAYSADKYYRLQMQNAGHSGYRWFADEQLNDEERSLCEEALFDSGEFCRDFIVMSHTCPQRYTPREMFILEVDQDTVDRTMEVWMDDLINRIFQEDLGLKTWYCGHWHTDKSVDVMRFMYHDIIELEAA